MQIASWTSPHIDVHVQHTHYQEGTSECGVYTITFATDLYELCYDNNPAAYITRAHIH